MLGNITPDFSQLRPDIEPKAKEMLSVVRVGDRTEIKINSSSLSIILSCPRKAYYSLHRNLKGKSESPALTFGTAIHKALEVFYSNPREARSFPTRFEEYSDLMAHGGEAPESHFLYDAISAFVAAAKPLALLPDSDKRSIPNGIWTLQHYFKTYINDIYVTYCDEHGPVTERTFDLVIHEDEKLKVTVFGTIDFVMQHAGNGSIIPGDHKTVSQLGSDFYNRIKPNHQYTCYVLGAQEVLGLPTESFLVNALQVKPRPVTARGSAPNFARQVTTRTPEDIAEFKRAVMFSVRNYLTWLETNDWPIGDVNNCAQWGGCQYLDVCSAPEKLRENILTSKFVTTGAMSE